MSEYHKIQTLFLRDPATNHKTLLEGQYARPEFEYLARNAWELTEKVDGTNIRIIVPRQGDDRKIRFGGKTERAQIPSHLLSALQDIVDPITDALLVGFPDGGVLYGEGYGPKIQKGGGNYRANPSFVLFDVRVGEWWLERRAVVEIGDKYGIDVVPIIGTLTLPDMVELVRPGFCSQWGAFQAEGVVARPQVELKNRSGERIITKLKSKDFTR